MSAPTRTARKHPTILVLGHWMVDHILHLPNGILLSTPLPTTHVHVPVLSQLGGSGYHFSIAAKHAGFGHVQALVTIGNDRPGREILKAARRARIGVIPCTSQMKTAEAFLIYDVSDRRAAFGTREANLDLPDFATKALETLQPVNAFVAGHILEDEKKRTKVLALLKRLRRRSCFVVLDVVPHNLQKMISRRERRDLALSVSGIVGSRNALAAFLEDSATHAWSDHRVVEALLPLFEWVCMHPNNDKLVVGSRIDTNQRIYESCTSYSSYTVKAGVLDRAVARELLAHVVGRSGIREASKASNRTHT
jgi:sugar/nucleoside kinase (ribokinase family)